jgi:hypothetical protein
VRWPRQPAVLAAGIRHSVGEPQQGAGCADRRSTCRKQGDDRARPAPASTTGRRHPADGCGVRGDVGGDWTISGTSR